MTQLLLFVVGMGRSGTTLMGSILGLHSRVFMLRELHFFGQIWRAGTRPRLTDAQAVAMVSKLLSRQRVGLENRPDPQPFVEEAARLLKAHADRSCTAPEAFEAFLRYETGLHGKTIPCDHTPRNVRYAEQILRLYPAAKVIHMVRDPRDVLASQKHKWRMRAGEEPLEETLRRRVNYHPVLTSLRWNAALREGDAVSGHERYRVVRFEDLLRDPQAQLRSLCDFLELDFQSRMLDVPLVNSSFQKTNGRGVDPAATGRWPWALTATEVRICQRLTREGMRRHGYEPASVPPRVVGPAVALVLCPVHAVLGFLMGSLRFRKLVSIAVERLQAVRGRRPRFPTSPPAPRESA